MIGAEEENPMIEPPQIVQAVARHTAVIRFTIPREQIQEVMGPGHSELMDAVAAQGIATTGPWFSHHFTMDPATFDFEIGVPVAAPISPVGRVRPGALPAATVARTVYHGDYGGLGDGWGELMAWIEAAGHTPAPDLWEVYTVGPESDPDPAAWRTELDRPLVAETGGRP
jgi:effector-binding domain-containing protein